MTSCPDLAILALVFVQLDHSLLDVGCGLLHRVEFRVAAHPAIVVSVLGHQSFQPLHFTLALASGCFPCAVPGSLFKLSDDGVVARLCRHHRKSVPLHFIIISQNFVQWIVERVLLHLALAYNAQDGAGFGVALHLNLLEFFNLRFRAHDVEFVCSAAGCGVGARGFAVVETEGLDRLLHTARGVVQARGQTEASIVLGERFFLVPRGLVSVRAWQEACAWQVPVGCYDGVL